MAVVDLNVNRSLVVSNFDGYKLSFDPVPVLRQELECDPVRQELAADDFSLLHAQLFDLQNHLFADPWMRHYSYFFNVRHQLVQCRYDPLIGHADGQRVVYTMDYRDQGDGHKPNLTDYNYTLIFVSERFCVICDGRTSYHLIDTGDRSRSGPQEWQRITHTRVNSTIEFHGFILYDARLDMVKECKQISLVAGHVARRPAVGGRQTQIHFMDLTLGRWTQSLENNEWSYSVCQSLETTGSIFYCAFEPRAESLIIASNREVQTREQRKITDEAAVHAGPDAAANAVSETFASLLENGGEANYTWSQTIENVVITLEVPPFTLESDFNVRCTTCTVVVEYKTQVIFTASLYSNLDPDYPEWKIRTDGLEVVLAKKEHEHWPRLLAELEGGVAEQIISFEGGQMPIPNLADPVEECDIDNDDTKMVRFNLPSGSITHTIFLSSSPLLFTTTLRPGFPAAFATREGVDASIWLQMYQPTRPDEWSVRHEGQLHAFGYVLASKQQRKFTGCCPDLDYVVICESCRHVIIYRPHHDSASGLRKRNGPPVTLGKQSLITMPDHTGEILGMTTANNVITILSKKALLHLQV
ncbi:nudC domain-containing protein 1-like [Drosophila eugracilis]|uniref:nudC domain-containing protein 1-like n=1 Tax=Drosophila eugracilis TaxID=29029 RepID=UPI0007E76852|nr:nudC domain-containing protein 1-like [Drosophila eugracilis]